MSYCTREKKAPRPTMILGLRTGCGLPTGRIPVRNPLCMYSNFPNAERRCLRAVLKLFQSSVASLEDRHK